MYGKLELRGADLGVGDVRVLAELLRDLRDQLMRLDDLVQVVRLHDARHAPGDLPKEVLSFATVV